jgi:arylsulfatase A-like enzyme
MLCLRTVAVAGLLLPLLACGGSGGTARSAVLLVIDTCRYDEIGRITPAGPVTPNIDRFAATASAFSGCTAPAPWTLPSVASLLTAVYPTAHGALGRYPNFARLRPEVRTAAELLTGAGFETGAYVNVAFLDPILGLGRGFASYDYAAGANRKSRSASETVDEAIRWIDRHRAERFFLFVHFFDPHMDYDPPEPFRSRFLAGYAGSMKPPFAGAERWKKERPITMEVRDFARSLYRGEIAAVDEACGLLLTHLETAGLAKETVVAIVSDHGEEFWDHGAFEHGHSLYEEVIHVPCLIRSPGAKGPRRIDARVSLVDVIPTLFELLDIPAESAWQGESLVPLLEGKPPKGPRYRYSESLLYGYEWKAVVGDRYKFSWDEERDKMALFDLGVDPGEKRDLSKERPEEVRAMASVLLEWFRGLLDRTGGSLQGETVDMEKEVVEQLRALGYVE